MFRGVMIAVFCALGCTLADPGQFVDPLYNAFKMEQQVPLEQGEEAGEVGQHWALLVAGSNTWGNYRHQADVCHAYQILKAHGLPDERIVVMMYDDIANNEENPTPGKIINHPNGPDVYHGVPKDYTKDDVTPENFLQILQGDEIAMKGIGSGKVIKSGPNDHVFVNFVDHGAPGLVAFPDDVLTASQLNKVIKAMHKDNKFKQMVFYVEACESGSMFHNLLPKDINVYATTAANGKESSYACYLDKLRQTFLGDVYSVKWMEDSDKENLNLETLHKQYTIVKRETNTSHVMQYGELKLAKDKVAEFQGSKQTEPIIVPPAPLNAVPSPDVPLALLYHKLDAATTPSTRRQVMSQITSMLRLRGRIEGTMKSIAHIVTRETQEAARMVSIHHEINNFECYEPLVDLFSQRCYKLSQYDYALRQLYVLVNLCEEGINQNVIREAILNVCDGNH